MINNKNDLIIEANSTVNKKSHSIRASIIFFTFFRIYYIFDNYLSFNESIEFNNKGKIN